MIWVMLLTLASNQPGPAEGGQGCAAECPDDPHPPENSSQPPALRTAGGEGILDKILEQLTVTPLPERECLDT